MDTILAEDLARTVPEIMAADPVTRVVTGTIPVGTVDTVITRVTTPVGTVDTVITRGTIPVETVAMVTILVEMEIIRAIIPAVTEEILVEMARTLVIAPEALRWTARVHLLPK